MDPVSVAPASTANACEDAWIDDAIGSSGWIGTDTDLATLARSLRRHNPPIRAAASVRAADLLRLPRRRDQVARGLVVSAEIGRQAGGLGLDLHRIARVRGNHLPGLLLEGFRNLRAARSRLAAAGFDPATHADGAGREADPVRAALATRLRTACEALGPTFVKFGQLLGSADGLLPPEVVAEFGGCRDDVAPLRFDVVVREVERALGRLDERFVRFDRVPLASASIAQVHAATLQDGSEVVVKVQRPGVRAVVERDVRILHALTRAIERVEIASTANLSGMVALFAQTVLEELDFRLEAENMIAVALSLESTGASEVVVPRPVPGGVTPTVLVMERLYGRRLHEPGGPGAVDPDSDDAVDALALLRTGTQAVLESALVHGLFHGDMHAGNMLLLDDGRYGLLDFGIVGRFDAGQRRALWAWITAMMNDDLAAQLVALDGLGAFPPDTDVALLAAGLDVALANLEDADASTFDEVAVGFERIARILQTHGMRVPKELALFLKNLLHVNASMRVVAPERDPYSEVGDIFGVVSERCRAAG